MKIIQVIPSLAKGGAERLVLDISLQLTKLGHEVFIITFREENQYSELSSGLNIITIPSQVSYSITGKNLVQTHDFDQKVREISPDIIHSHLLESEFVSRENPMKGVRYITHWHGCHPPTNELAFKEYFSPSGWWKIHVVRTLKKKYAKCNNEFICISEFIKNYVKRAISPENHRLHVLLNGTDLSNFKHEAIEKERNSFKLVSVGSFHPYKNQAFLLRVMKKLKTLGKTSFQLQLLGDGVERENLKAYTEEHDLTDMVQFLGYVDNPSYYMNRANALVHTAIDEPFGLILLEVMSCKLPVVAFRSGGVPEIVENGKTGLLTEINDIDEFVASLCSLEANAELQMNLGDAAHLSVQKFSIEHYARSLEDLYNELLTKHSL